MLRIITKLNFLNFQLNLTNASFETTYEAVVKQRRNFRLLHDRAYMKTMSTSAGFSTISNDNVFTRAFVTVAVIRLFKDKAF